MPAALLAFDLQAAAPVASAAVVRLMLAPRKLTWRRHEAYPVEFAKNWVLSLTSL